MEKLTRFLSVIIAGGVFFFTGEKPEEWQDSKDKPIMAVSAFCVISLLIWLYTFGAFALAQDVFIKAKNWEECLMLAWVLLVPFLYLTQAFRWLFSYLAELNYKKGIADRFILIISAFLALPFTLIAWRFASNIYIGRFYWS